MSDQRKLRQNVGLENMNMTSQTTHTNYKRHWMKPPMKIFCVRNCQDELKPKRRICQAIR